VLGTNLVHPVDMATAYGTLANRGIRVDPVYVTQITRVDGSVLYEHQHRQERAISEQTADEVTSVLQQAVARGTGTRARLGDRPVAGKTGTGQGWKDAWFVGFTPDLVTAVWMGFTEEEQSMRPPATPIRVTGGSWPATIWHAFAEPAHAGIEIHGFPEVILRQGGDEPLDLDDLLLPRVPDVGGIPVGQARQLLEEAGYRVSERSVTAPSTEPGLVVGQTPPGGSRLEAGQLVVVNVASGATLVNVPDTLGLSETNARAAIEGAGLRVQVLVQEGGTPGVVWSQSPAGGSSVVSGSVIQVWVTPTPTTTTEPPATTTTTTPPATASTTTTTIAPENTTTTVVSS
jgi:penicillin-binding protein 1A